MDGRQHPARGPHRRDLLRVCAGALLAVTTGAGCDLLSTDPSGKASDDQKAPTGRKEREAPMLAKRVRASALPLVRDCRCPRPSGDRQG